MDCFTLSLFIVGHSHFIDFQHWDLTFCLWLLLSMDHGVGDTLGSFFLAYLVDIWYPSTFHFIPRYSILHTFTPISFLPELNHYLLWVDTFHHDTWPHFLLSWLGKDVDQSSSHLVELSYIFWTLGSTFSMIVELW